MSATYLADLEAAKSEALARLLKIIRESPSETQVRLAAAVILRLPVPKAESDAPAVSPKPTVARSVSIAADAPDHPALTRAELVEAKRLMPEVDEAELTRPGMANHWREAIRVHHLREKLRSPADAHAQDRERQRAA